MKKRLGEDAVPMTVFAKDGHYALEQISDSDYDVIGIDWCTPPEFARSKCKGKTLQGNLDPCALYSSKNDLIESVRKMIESFGTNKYIVNLGHGIYPDMSPEAVNNFIDAVHAVKIE